MVQALAQMVRNALRVAFRRALPGKVDERVLGRGKAFAHFVGIFVRQLIEREGEPGVERQRLLDRLRCVAEEACHLGGRFEKSLGIDGEPAAGLVDRQVLADAGDHVLQCPPVGVVIEHVIDGDQRHAGRPCGLGAAGKPRAVIAAIEHGCREPHALGRRIVEHGEKRRLSGSRDELELRLAGAGSRRNDLGPAFGRAMASVAGRFPFFRSRGVA